VECVGGRGRRRKRHGGYADKSADSNGPAKPAFFASVYPAVSRSVRDNLTLRHGCREYVLYTNVASTPSER
jgi:hypothetical protein